MDMIKIEDRYILEYIRDMLSSYMLGTKDVSGYDYHHCTPYENVSIMIKNGILTISDLDKLGIKKFTSDQLQVLADWTSHINGIDSVSLAIVGLTDLYKDEEEYDPLTSMNVDILVDSRIKTCRTTYHYGNEFLAKGSIDNDRFGSVDIRLIKYLEEFDSRVRIGDKNIELDKVVSKYNMLREIALSLRDNELDIPFREMSTDSRLLDKDKVSKGLKLVRG